MPSMLDWAYTAGMLDGEGTVGIYTHKYKVKGKEYENWILVVSIANTDLQVIDWLANTFDGHGYGVIRPSRPQQKTCYTFSLRGMRALNFLRRCQPHLKVKRRQAEVAMKFIEEGAHGKPGRWQGRLPDEEVERREGLRQQMRLLNQKGPRPGRVELLA